MSSSDWEEVKRLASDFKRTQLSGTIQRLSERNCIEIVKKLIELNLINVIFTVDGKEYITPEYLLKEIEDELIYSGGRVSLTDLVGILNVDFNHIESKANEFAHNSDGAVSLVLGQLVNKDYKDKLCEEVNDKLQQAGVTSVGELTKIYDLPADFIAEILLSRLNVSFHGVQDSQDPRVFFTNDYINQYKAKLVGILSGVTRPTSMNTLCNRFKLPDRIVTSLIDGILKEKRILGHISSNRIFTPDIYGRSQNEWVESFYRQNGYLEFDALTRIGIQDIKVYLKRFNDLIQLQSCCVSNQILYQVESSIEESIEAKSWVDLTSILPSVLHEKDVNLLINKVLDETGKLGESCIVICKTVVVSNHFIELCFNPFCEKMKQKADEDMKSGTLFKVFAAAQEARDKSLRDDSKSATLSKKEERRKKASTKEKSGGGTQGREVKTKATKKKYKPNQKGGQNSDDSDQEDISGGISTNPSELAFLSVGDVESVIRSEKNLHLDDCPDQVVNQLARHLVNLLKDKYYEIAKSTFASNTSSGETRKKTFSDVQQMVNSLFMNIVAFQKGLILFEDDMQQQLSKYLLRTLCSDIVNVLVLYLTNEDTPNVLTPETRLKLINKMESYHKEHLSKLNTALGTKSVEEFLNQLDVTAENVELMLKKDKKREKTIISENRQNLLLQLSEAEQKSNELDAALILHVVVLFLFESQTKQILHASGKFVPQILSFLKPTMDVEKYNLLHECEQLVIKQLSMKSKEDENEEEKEAINSRLNEIIPKIKELVFNPAQR